MKHFEEKIGQLAVINFLQTTQGGDSLNMLMKHPVGPSIWLEIHTGKVKTRELPFCGKITIMFSQRFSILFLFFISKFCENGEKLEHQAITHHQDLTLTPKPEQ